MDHALEPDSIRHAARCRPLSEQHVVHRGRPPHVKVLQDRHALQHCEAGEGHGHGAIARGKVEGLGLRVEAGLGFELGYSGCSSSGSGSGLIMNLTGGFGWESRSHLCCRDRLVGQSSDERGRDYAQDQHN